MAAEMKEECWSMVDVEVEPSATTTAVWTSSEGCALVLVWAQSLPSDELLDNEDVVQQPTFPQPLTCCEG
ncbi:hypothetical protein EYF80_042063 [Liparis tanakae]|uniref:Uncharacterized protein n=1 Tax=Liparis tanakae TaxID=230148 RepID=A0A4Z2G4N2_9TELE|nr:hypothetical protein EYF80_042063 [Liparis tanakae]